MYLNPGKAAFEEAVGSAIYVDKTSMIRRLNEVVCTEQKYVCVSRPRRFGKTMAAKMLCAYYGRGANSRELFAERLLATSAADDGCFQEWDVYLERFDVVRVTMTEFLDGGEDVAAMIDYLTDEVSGELTRAFPEVDFGSRSSLRTAMGRVYQCTGRKFVVVIDEWDAPMRQRRGDEAGQRAYLDFLRNWLKDKEWIALAYMTGILPVKKYGAHSALNMFDEYSMAMPLWLAPYTGFTVDEVRAICSEHGVSFEAMQSWYDGYRLSNEPSADLVECLGEGVASRAGGASEWEVYNPLSVVSAARTLNLKSYWSRTETYEALAEYIRMDFDGLKLAVALMMDGGRVPVDLGTYQNDMDTFACRDDVLALLVHLGYLGYDSLSGEAFVPNREVRGEFELSTREPAWDLAFRDYERSKKLVQATLAGDERAVADALQAAHDQASNKDYNSEAALSYAVQLAYYAARRHYTTVLELDSGKGFADVCYLPAPGRSDLPVLLVELKWNEGAHGAIAQIRDRDYPQRLAHYEGNILLVGVSYDRRARPGAEGYKRHSCIIEHA